MRTWSSKNIFLPGKRNDLYQFKPLSVIDFFHRSLCFVGFILGNVYQIIQGKSGWNLNMWLPAKETQNNILIETLFALFMSQKNILSFSILRILKCLNSDYFDWTLAETASSKFYLRPPPSELCHRLLAYFFWKFVQKFVQKNHFQANILPIPGALLMHFWCTFKKCIKCASKVHQNS